MKRNNLFLAIALVSLFCTSEPVKAQTGSPTGGTPYVMPAVGSGGNAAESGRSTEKTQLITAAINVGAAGMYMGICAKPKCAGCWACPLVGLASTAASMLGNGAGQSGAAGADMSGWNPVTQTYGPGGYGPDGLPLPGPGGPGTGGPADVGTNGNGGGLPDGTTPSSITTAVNQIRGELERTGTTISADGRTMTTKDGRKYDLTKSGDGSPQSLMAMGLTASEAGQATEAGKKFAAAAAAKYAGMLKMGDGGGGGAARAPAGEGGAGGAGGWAGFKDPFNKNRPKAKISGLTRKLGDDTIGVAGDDIFEMVTRRYKARDQVNQFLKD